MKVEVRLFANLRDNYPKESKGVLTVELPRGSTVGNLIENLNLPDGLPLIVMINGKRQPETALLNDNDRVGIFPPVGGG